jgi:hypothetical protein
LIGRRGIPSFVGTFPHAGRRRLGHHWYQDGPTRVAFDAQGTPLPASVAPGQSVELAATVVAPDVPGRYTLAWDMRAQCEWLTKMGAAPGNQAVEVSPAR